MVFPIEHSTRSDGSRKISLSKVIVFVCGGLMSLFGLVVIGALAYFGLQPEGGVLLANQMSNRELSYVRSLEIPLDEALAYLDRSVLLDQSDVVVVTRSGVVHSVDERRTEIFWGDVMDIESRDEGMSGDAIEIEMRDGQLFRILVAPMNGGVAMQKQIESAWRAHPAN